MSYSCCDYYESDWTSFKIPNFLRHSHLATGAKASETIELLQEPSETVKIDFEFRPVKLHFQTESWYDSEFYKIFNDKTCRPQDLNIGTFSVMLTFENHLHELSQDYTYDVVFKLLMLKDGYLKHYPLFSHELKRTSDTAGTVNLTFTVRPDGLQPRGWHICGAIRRRCHVKEFTKGHPSANDTIATLFNSGFDNDASLVVGPKTFPVHREVLSLKSKVFKELFAANRTKGEKVVMKIDNDKPELVEEMLYFLYTGETRDISKMAQELFELAHEYEIDELKFKCVEWLMVKINFSDAMQLWDVVKKCEIIDLKANTMAFMKNHGAKMVEQPTYQQHLLEVLSYETLVDTLILCSEHNLPEIREKAFNIAKAHQMKLAEDMAFLELFTTKPNLMKDLYVYFYKKKLK